MSALTLVMQCPDQKGIIAEVTQFVYSHKGNILYIDQYVDRENQAFFMRLESEFNGNSDAIENFRKAFDRGPAQQFEMKWTLQPQEQKLNMALFVSKYDQFLILGHIPKCPSAWYLLFGQHLFGHPLMR